MGLRAMYSSLTQGNIKDAFDNVFISDADIAMHQEVANAQTAIVERQYNDGLIDRDEAAGLYSEIARNAFVYNPDSIGTEGTPADVFAADVAKRWDTAKSTLTKVIPWWGWLILGIVAIAWAWPILSVVFNRFRGSK